jgi:hypothetical protein
MTLSWKLTLVVAILVAVGCDSTDTPATGTAPGDAGRTGQAPSTKPDVKKVPLSPKDKNVWLEIQGKERRVVVNTEVCLRKAGFGLECLLCRKGTKEHESILVTEADARLIHAGLEACGAKPGSTVEYDPKFKAPSGGRIRMTLQFEWKGKTIAVPAQQWVRNVKTKKNLEHEWVFAGSRLIPNPVDDKKTPIYLAHNDGAFICISNVPSAMLDLPIDSPKGVEDRGYDTNERRIPPLGTKVTLILEPIPDKKKVAPVPEKYDGPLFEETGNKQGN